MFGALTDASSSTFRTSVVVCPSFRREPTTPKMFIRFPQTSAVFS